jgi:hypothetical protein
MAEKKSRFCAETKKYSNKCPFWAVSAQRTYCAGPFLALSAHWTTVDHEHGPLCTREPEKTISRPIFGPFWGQKGNFQKKKKIQ